MGDGGRSLDAGRWSLDGGDGGRSLDAGRWSLDVGKCHCDRRESLWGERGEAILKEFDKENRMWAVNWLRDVLWSILSPSDDH